MTKPTAEVKARNYLDFMRSADEPRLGSPWEVVQDALDKDPEHAWQIILSAVAQSTTDDDLSNVGTGPLESLLVHHSEFVGRALEEARMNPKFRNALRSADIRGGRSEEVDRLDDFFERLDTKID